MWGVEVITATTDGAGVHRLVDLLPEIDLDPIRQIMQRLVAAQSDPFLRALAEAPEDDEPVTEDDIAAATEADADIAAGRVISDEELCRRLGL